MLWWYIANFGWYLGVTLWAIFTSQDIVEAFNIALKLLGLR